MTKVFLQPGLRALSGGMGDWVYQLRNGKTVLGMKPLNTKEPTQAQNAHRERFKQAALYAKGVMADELARAFYEAISKEKDKPSFALAVGDFLNKPSIRGLDLDAYHGKVGDPIWIGATDDIGIVSMNVSITSVAGTFFEQGEAIETPAGSGQWLYAATVVVPVGTDTLIKAVAKDRPGGTGTVTENITVEL